MLSSTNTRHVASYPLVSTNENEDEEEDEQQQKNDPERERELDDKNTTGRKRELAEMSKHLRVYLVDILDWNAPVHAQTS